MTEQCVTLAANNRYLEFVGNVLNVQIMIYVLYVIIPISTRFATVFLDLPRQKVAGNALFIKCIVIIFEQKSQTIVDDRVVYDVLT